MNAEQLSKLSAEELEAKRQAYYEDVKTLDDWAAAGCVSGFEADSFKPLYEEAQDAEEED